MVKEVSYQEIKRNSGFRKEFSLTFPLGKSTELFYEIVGGQKNSGDYLDQVQKGKLPAGIFKVTSLDNNKYFRIICAKTKQEEAVKFAQSLFS